MGPIAEHLEDELFNKGDYVRSKETPSQVGVVSGEVSKGGFVYARWFLGSNQLDGKPVYMMERVHTDSIIHLGEALISTGLASLRNAILR